MKVSWTTYATSDLIGIRDFIAIDSQAYARVVVERILSRVAQLETFPESGQMVPEYGRKDLREVLAYSYRVIHQVLPGEVRIITIVQGAKPLPPSPPVNR